MKIRKLNESYKEEFWKLYDKFGIEKDRLEEIMTYDLGLNDEDIENLSEDDYKKILDVYKSQYGKEEFFNNMFDKVSDTLISKLGFKREYYDHNEWSHDYLVNGNVAVLIVDTVEAKQLLRKLEYYN